MKVAAPAGDFFLEPTHGEPVVLVSGGVGLTPMVSMLEAVRADKPDRPLAWVHGALNGRVQAMHGHVRDLVSGMPATSAHVFHAEPLPTNRRGVDYDEAGLISVPWLARHTPLGNATFFLYGPRPFLRTLVNGLARHGVPRDRIRYEFFGPADEMLDAA